MQDETEVLKRLLRVASAGASHQGERRTTRRAERSLLVAVLEELDSIVLPRRLCLERPDGECLTLVAGNRRLIESESPISGRKSWGSEEPVQLEQLRSQLDDFIAAADSLIIRTEEAPRSSANGITARSLASAFGETLTSPEPVDPQVAVGSFLNENRDRIKAWCHTDGRRVESGGDHERHLRLRKVMEAVEPVVQDYLHGSTQLDAGEFFFALAPKPDEAETLILAGLQNNRLGLYSTPDDFAQIASGWKAARRRHQTSENTRGF